MEVRKSPTLDTAPFRVFPAAKASTTQRVKAAGSAALSERRPLLYMAAPEPQEPIMTITSPGTAPSHAASWGMVRNSSSLSPTVTMAPAWSPSGQSTTPWEAMKNRDTSCSPAPAKVLLMAAPISSVPALRSVLTE